MSQKETTDTTGRLDIRDSPNAEVTRLAELAREAFERRATKECLDLTRAILLIDPHHSDAHWMRTSIQSEMHRDLDNARAFLRQAQGQEPAQAEDGSAMPAGEAAAAAPSPDSAPDSVTGSGAPPVKRSLQSWWLMSGGAVLFLGILLASLPGFRSKSNSVEASPLSANAPDKSRQAVPTDPAQQDAMLPNAKAAAAAPQPAISSGTAATPAVTVHPPAAAPPAAAPPADAMLLDRPVMAANGTLAVSSLTSVDIYKDDVLLGSVPTSLQFSAGPLTLEYRHGSLRRTLTHVIKSNETTRAIVNFDIDVRINCKPWAQVFMDVRGMERKDLGQTPLGGVDVAIGSVLTFENPQFPARQYRVTGNETAIQIVFP